MRIPLTLLTLACASAAQTPQPPLRSSAPQPTLASLAGDYDGHQMEVGARLLLKSDGHFSYELAYGALDETAEGTWEIKSATPKSTAASPSAPVFFVLLTTVPAAVPPRFVVESDKPAPAGELWVKLAKPIMEGARQRIYLVYGPDHEPDMAEVADDGRVPLPGNRWPTAIMPEIPVYPITPKPIPLTGAAGHRLTLRFEANDIGKADFHPQALTLDNGELVMPRRDLGLLLHFKRQP